MTKAASTMSDIARLAGVSKNTVSLALRHDPQIPPSTRTRIAQIARQLGYSKDPVVAHLMARLRCRRQPGFKATLALVNANEDPSAFRSHPTIPAYVRGCQRRAQDLGYSLDEFWLHDKKLDGRTFNKILNARHIEGLLLVGLMNTNHLPERFLPTWETFPCVVTGVRTSRPALSFASADHHMLVLRAVEKALSLGYRRPALVIDRVIDRLVEGRFSAGFMAAQQAILKSGKTRPYLFESETSASLKGFRTWFERERPDVILTLYNVIWRWLEAMEKNVPRDVGLIQLEWRTARPNWAGMNQHNDIVGEAAVEMLVGMIHRSENGIPEFPRATLIGSTWKSGSTLSLVPSRH